MGPEACGLVDRLVRLRALHAPPAVRRAAEAGWRRRWWALLSAALQRALASTLLGGRLAFPRAAGCARRARPRRCPCFGWPVRAQPSAFARLVATSAFSAAVSGGGGLRVPWVSLPLDGKRRAFKKKEFKFWPGDGWRLGGRGPGVLHRRVWPLLGRSRRVRGRPAAWRSLGSCSRHGFFSDAQPANGV